VRKSTTTRNRNEFGAGTYTRRHEQRYQAVTGAVVISLAIATLTLHHFGFALALIVALCAAVLSAATRIRATVAVYVVGLALFAGILVTPMQGTQEFQVPLNASTMSMSPQGAFGPGYELYVLEGPALDRSHLRSAPFDWETKRPPQDSLDSGNGSTQIPTPYSRQIFEL